MLETMQNIRSYVNSHAGAPISRQATRHDARLRARARPALIGVSLFSGAGGLDLGLAGAGVDFTAWVESDKDAQETLKANFDVHCEALFGDISDVKPRDLLAHQAPDIFVVAGGPPCQAFSTAGRRQSVHDPRGAVVDRYFRVVGELRPRFFVFENVRGLLSAAVKHRPLTHRGPESCPLSTKERLGSLLRCVLLPRFNALGYEVVVGLADAADYGVPQRRVRVIVLGSRDGEFRVHEYEAVVGRPLTLRDLMPPTHSAPARLPKNRLSGAAGPDDRRLPWLTLRDALADLPSGDPEYMGYSPARRNVFERIPPGANWRYIRDNPERFPRGFLARAMGGALHAAGGRVGFWRRLAWDEPSPTLTTSPVQKATAICHPDDTRPLSVQEYRRVQQFPDSFVVKGGTASKYRQLGNAVPVGLARAIGDALVRASEARPWKAPDDIEGSAVQSAGKDSRPQRATSSDSRSQPLAERRR